MRVFCYYC